MSIIKKFKNEFGRTVDLDVSKEAFADLGFSFLPGQKFSCQGKLGEIIGIYHCRCKYSLRGCKKLYIRYGGHVKVEEIATEKIKQIKVLTK